MSKIEGMVMELAKELRKEGLNFVIAIEDNGIHSQSSIKGKSVLSEVNKVLKAIIKK